MLQMMARVLLVLVFCGAAIRINAKPLTVCELLADLPKYRGKVVEVRGWWITGTGHGFVLRAPDPGCKRPLRTKSVVWIPALAAGESKEPDFDSLALAEILLERLNPKEGDVVIITLVGVIESDWPLQVAASLDGTVLLPYGRGPMNKFPAQIHYNAIKDPVLVRATNKN